MTIGRHIRRKEMNKHLGYINVKEYTDMKSYRVFTTGDGKFYACQVVKKRACNPKFKLGGFAGRCTNQDEVWSGNDVIDIDEPFEIVNKNGVWGYYSESLIVYMSFGTRFEAEEFFNRRIEGNEEKFRWVLNGNDVLCYAITPKGKIRKKFNKLGKFEDTCRYFFDYNF